MQAEPKHHIDRHILKVLTFNKTARYRDLRPKNTDSNLFNYHRKVLLQQGYIVQNADKTYSLGAKGFRLAEKASFDDLRIRERPKLSVLFLIKDKKDRVAVWDKPVQPFIGTVNLPNGKIRLEDKGLSRAAERMLGEIISGNRVKMKHSGVADVCVMQGKDIITYTLNMVFSVEAAPVDITSELIYWLGLNELRQVELTPGVEDVINDFWQTKHCLSKSYVVKL